MPWLLYQILIADMFLSALKILKIHFLSIVCCLLPKNRDTLSSHGSYEEVLPYRSTSVSRPYDYLANAPQPSITWIVPRVIRNIDRFSF